MQVFSYIDLAYIALLQVILHGAVQKIRNAKIYDFDPLPPLVTHPNTQKLDPPALRNAKVSDPPPPYTHFIRNRNVTPCLSFSYFDVISINACYIAVVSF